MLFFFYTYTASSDIYTLSLHDALPISRFSGARVLSALRLCAPWPRPAIASASRCVIRAVDTACGCWAMSARFRSEEHTSELQSRENLVCRLLLEKKNTRTQTYDYKIDA